jgi:lipoprotein-releasing system permease protein
VVLGVLVLIVVMAIYAGLERSVKDRLLGFSPHILMTQSGFGATPLDDWRDAAELAAGLPRAVSATAFVSDNVIIDVETWQRPVMFRGIDTSDPAQVEGVAAMLDLENFPGSSADFGLDDRVVVSSLVAEQYRIGVGDTVRLLSTRNVEPIIAAARATDLPPLREAFAEPWLAGTGALLGAWQEAPAGADAAISVAALMEAFTALEAIWDERQRLREVELGMLEGILIAMEDILGTTAPDELTKVLAVPADLRASIEANITALNTTVKDEMDSDIFRNLKSIILPREAEVVGVYQASQMAVTPDLFVPLHLAQGLAGLDDGVQGIAVRLDDPYAAEQVAARARELLGPGWQFSTWGDQAQAFSALINQQRVMMYFVLSFIVLVSAFSMMAVMFTVTIQKKQEIGVMKALGAAPGQIVRVFLYQGMLLGALGALLGVGLGHVILYFRGGIQGLFRGFGFDPFSASLTGFEVLPAYSDPTEQILIAVSAFVLCSLAAFVPASIAARSDAAKSLRNL